MSGSFFSMVMDYLPQGTQIETGGMLWVYHVIVPDRGTVEITDYEIASHNFLSNPKGFAEFIMAKLMELPSG